MEICNQFNVDGNPYLREQVAATGKLTLIGHCVASEVEIAEAASLAQSANDILPLTDLAGCYAGIWQTDTATTIFSDLVGQFAVYYRPTDEGLTISDSSYKLARMTGAEFDRVSLAADLCVNMNYLNEGHTLFEGVHRLPPATELRVEQEDIKRRIYDSLMPRPEIDFKTATEQTRAALTGAIQYRLDTPCLTSDFSGGHDSTALAMLGASLGERPIPSFIQYSNEWPAGDIMYARRLAKLDPRIQLKELTITAADLPYSALLTNSSPFFDDEPYKVPQAIEQMLVRLKALQECRSTLNLTGMGGDALFDVNPSLTELLRQGRTEQAEQQAFLLGRLSLKSPADLMESAHQHISTDLPTALAMLADACRHPNTSSYTSDWLWEPAANIQWLTPEMRRLLAERVEKYADQVPPSFPADALKSMAAIRDNAEYQRHARYLGGHIFHAPFFDHRVVRVVSQLELGQRAPVGSFKPLLHAALAGHGVPPEVFQRTSKGSYLPIVRAGERQIITEALRLLDGSRLVAMDIIDPRVVRQSIESYGLTRDRYHLSTFVTAEAWLQRHELTHAKGTPEVGVVQKSREHTLTPGRMAVLSGYHRVVADAVFAAGPDQMVVLNIRSGRYGALNGTAVDVLRLINDKGMGQIAAKELIKDYPTADPIEIQSRVADMIIKLTKMCVLEEVEAGNYAPVQLPGHPSSPYTPDVEKFRVRPLHPTEEYDFSEAEIEASQKALHKASELCEQGLAATIEFLQSQWEMAGSTSNQEDIRRDKVLVQQLAMGKGHTKQRIACYESSLAVAILAARRGERIEWNIGVSFRPPRNLHAWVEAHGKPVLISTDAPLDGYQRLLQI